MSIQPHRTSRQRIFPAGRGNCYTLGVKVVLFGPNGYLGRNFLARNPAIVPAAADIASAAEVAAVLEREQPDVVINAAGKTGRPNIDWCEDHKEETVRGNVTGPLVLLHACLSRGVRLVHIGSGCIYEGDNGGRGFAETDRANYFDSFYSRTKVWADEILSEFPVLILRLRMPFDGTDEPRSLLNKIRRYPRVLDVNNSITYLPDFLAVAEHLIDRGATGIYNVVNPGVTSPYRIMQEYARIVDPSHRCERLTMEQLREVAKTGRSNCVLSTDKLLAEGIALRPVDIVVEEALRSMATPH